MRKAIPTYVLIGMIREYAKELGRIPWPSEMIYGAVTKTKEKVPTYDTYRKRFEGWDNLIRVAKLDVLFPNDPQVVKPGTKKPRYEQAAMKAGLIQLRDCLGKIPTEVDMNERGGEFGLPVCDTYVKYFGSWNNALHECLGIPMEDIIVAQRTRENR